MRTGGGESRAFAFADVVNVNAVDSWRQLRHVYINSHTAARRAYHRGADVLSLCVDDVRVRGLRETWGGPQKRREENPIANKHGNLPFHLGGPQLYTQFFAVRIYEWLCWRAGEGREAGARRW